MLGQTTERVSVDSGGLQGNKESYHSSISSDGRFVVFFSHATNLVPGDANSAGDVFFRDRQTGQTKRVSVDSGGLEGNSWSRNPSISSDGRFVAFQSKASNLVPQDRNGKADIFVHDRQTGLTTRVSVASGGREGGQASNSPSISSDGRYVAFTSWASNLVWNDWNGYRDIFVHDRQTGLTMRVSVAPGGFQGNEHSLYPSISSDGRFVTFQSKASNLVPGDTNHATDVFVYDRQAGQTARVSVDSGGLEGTGSSSRPSISADGRLIAFCSKAANLVPGDTNTFQDVFVHDQVTAQTTRVSVDSGGFQGNNSSSMPSISSDGRFVTFYSTASNLVPGDTNSLGDIFIHDRQTSQTTRVSVDSRNIQGDRDSRAPSISSDGQFVAFRSAARNLVPGDTNRVDDVFVHDRQRSAPVLTTQGSCPGSMTITATGATPSRLVAVVYGSPGSFTLTIPPCSGLVLGISNPTLGALISANTSGEAALTFNAHGGACGKTVQVVDVTTCDKSNTITL